MVCVQTRFAACSSCHHYAVIRNRAVCFNKILLGEISAFLRSKTGRREFRIPSVVFSTKEDVLLQIIQVCFRKRAEDFLNVKFQKQFIE